MCQEGVRQFAEQLQDQDIRGLLSDTPAYVRGGFGPGKGQVELFIGCCPTCRRQFPILKRDLVSEAYNLPDAAIYQRLRFQAPCLALGCVTEKTTSSRDPARHPGLRQRWQGLLWHVFEVAFVDVREDIVGEFSPNHQWAAGQVIPELSDIADQASEALVRAGGGGNIPRCSSPKTEIAIDEVLSPIMNSFGYHASCSSTMVHAFWWGHRLDLLYEKRDSGTISFEVKVDEDWDHPLGEPLANLLGHNAVINVRVAPNGDRLDPNTREYVCRGEELVQRTGRAEFIYIWSRRDRN